MQGSVFPAALAFRDRHPPQVRQAQPIPGTAPNTFTRRSHRGQQNHRRAPAMQPVMAICSIATSATTPACSRRTRRNVRYTRGGKLRRICAIVQRVTVSR
jgi:hypothetical protein